MKALTFAILCLFIFPSYAAKDKPIKLALSAAFISESGTGIYKQIVNYVSSKTGRNIEIVTGLSYDTINQMIQDGALDGGFICGFPYVLLKEKNIHIDLAVAPVMKAARYGNKAVYFSDLIVAKDSPYKTIEDLRGKHFVYNDELSNSGYNMPRAYFLEKNVGKSFFGKISRSGSHEESIRAVANKKADYSFIDSLVLDYEIHIKSKAALAVRVIHSLGPVGVPPLVLSSNLDTSLVKKIKDAFVGMQNDPAGRKILDYGLIKRFDVVSDADYKSVRERYEFSKSKNKLEIGK